MEHCSTVVVGAVCALLAGLAGPAQGDSRRQHSDAEGIWKAVVPPSPMPAAFDGLDPVVVAAGAQIQADCSLNWVNPDDGIRYCFSSGTSLQYFLDRPHEMIARAREQWARLKSSTPAANPSR